LDLIESNGSQISQFTAEILLLPLRKSKRSAYEMQWWSYLYPQVSAWSDWRFKR